MTLRKNIFLLLSLAFLLTACSEGKPSETTTAPISTAAPIITTAPTTTTVGTTALPVEPSVELPAVKTAEGMEKQATDVMFGGNFDFTHSVKYPHIDSAKPGAAALNDKIAAIYVPIIQKVKDGTEGTAVYRLGYDTAYSHSILCIHIDEQTGWQYSEGGASQRFYYYDAENDRELTTEEYLAAFDIAMEDAKVGALWSYDLAQAGYTADYDGEDELRAAVEYRLTQDGEITSTAEANTLYYQRYTEFADSVTLDGAFVNLGKNTVTLYFSGRMYTSDTFCCVLDKDTLLPVRPNYTATVSLTAADVQAIEITFADGKVTSALAPAAYANAKITIFSHKVIVFSHAKMSDAEIVVNNSRPKRRSNAGLEGNGYEYTFYTGDYIPAKELESIVIYPDKSNLPPVETAESY